MWSFVSMRLFSLSQYAKQNTYRLARAAESDLGKEKNNRKRTA